MPKIIISKKKPSIIFTKKPTAIITPKKQQPKTKGSRYA